MTDKWISVKDKLPTHGRPIIIAMEYADGVESYVGRWNTSGHVFVDYNGDEFSDDYEIIFWSELPSPPKP